MFRQYSVREGEELALVCRDTNNRNNANIGWRRKVRIISFNHQKCFFMRFIQTAISMLTNTDNVRWPGTTNLSPSDRESHKTP